MQIQSVSTDESSSCRKRRRFAPAVSGNGCRGPGLQPQATHPRVRAADFQLVLRSPQTTPTVQSDSASAELYSGAGSLAPIMLSTDNSNRTFESQPSSAETVVKVPASLSVAGDDNNNGGSDLTMCRAQCRRENIRASAQQVRARNKFHIEALEVRVEELKRDAEARRAQAHETEDRDKDGRQKSEDAPSHLSRDTASEALISNHHVHLLEAHGLPQNLQQPPQPRADANVNANQGQIPKDLPAPQMATLRVSAPGSKRFGRGAFLRILVPLKRPRRQLLGSCNYFYYCEYCHSPLPLLLTIYLG